MALDSRAKRAAVLSVGRPWMRGINPDVAAGAEWRSAVANTYPVKAFEGGGGEARFGVHMVSIPAHGQSIIAGRFS